MAADRSETCNLVKTLETWLRTVLRLIISSWAMVALPLPAATSSSTSRSRSVKEGNAAAVEPAPPGEVRDHTPGDLRTEDRLPGSRSANRANDLVLLGTFQQIAAGTGPHSREHRVVIFEHRENHDA